MRSDHPRARDVHALARPPDRGRESRDPPGASPDLDPWVQRCATHPAITPWHPDRDLHSDDDACDPPRRSTRAHPPDPNGDRRTASAFERTPPSTGDPPEPRVCGPGRARPPDRIERIEPLARASLTPRGATGPPVPRPAPDARAVADPPIDAAAFERRSQPPPSSPCADSRRSNGGCSASPRAVAGPVCHIVGRGRAANGGGLIDRACVERPIGADRAHAGPPGRPCATGWPDIIEPRCLSDDMHRERRHLVTVRRAAADPQAALGPPLDRRAEATSALAALSRDAAQTPPERPPQWRPRPPPQRPPSPPYWHMPSAPTGSRRDDSTDREAECSVSPDNPSVPPDASASGSIRSGVARDGPISQGGRSHPQARVRGRAPARSSYPRSDRGEARVTEGIRRSPVA